MPLKTLNFKDGKSIVVADDDAVDLYASWLTGQTDIRGAIFTSYRGEEVDTSPVGDDEFEYDLDSAAPELVSFDFIGWIGTMDPVDSLPDDSDDSPEG